MDENRDKNILKVHAFWDKRAGHVKQTRGIVQALAAFTEIEVTDIHLPDYTAWHSIADWGKFISSFFIPSLKDSEAAPDLIIGTGTHTHIPMLMHQKNKGGRVVTCMTPEWPLSAFMDLCFIPEHDNPPQKNNIMATMGPPNTALDLKKHCDGKGLILIGGKDEKTHYWDNGKILNRICQIIEREAQVFWTVSSSPRTPEDLLPLVKQVENKYSNTKFLPFNETPKGWVEEEYAKSEIAWVTADSVSMVYEALSAGCMVGAISVDWKSSNNKVARGIDHLEKNDKILVFEKWEKGLPWPKQSGLNEADRCARQILKRWWPQCISVSSETEPAN